MRRIADDRVIRVHDIGTLDDDRPYFVMDLANGGTLAERMAKGCAPQEALLLGAEAARAVQVLHDHGVLHRDVTPANLLHRPSGRRVAAGGRHRPRHGEGDRGSHGPHDGRRHARLHGARTGGWSRRLRRPGRRVLPRRGRLRTALGGTAVHRFDAHGRAVPIRGGGTGAARDEAGRPGRAGRPVGPFAGARPGRSPGVRARAGDRPRSGRRQLDHGGTPRGSPVARGRAAHGGAHPSPPIARRRPGGAVGCRRCSSCTQADAGPPAAAVVQSPANVECRRTCRRRCPSHVAVPPAAPGSGCSHCSCSP